MNLRRDQYLNQIVYDVFREFFPNIRCSVYFRHEQSPVYGVAEYNGNNFYLYSGAFPASIFGTSQALQYDQDFTHFGEIYYSPTGALYDHTPFNVFRFAANRVRGSLLSFPSELTPWIAPKHYSPLMSDNRYYEEMLLHSMLAGAKEHIFWNPIDIATRDDNKVLDQTLKEIERISDFSELRERAFDQLSSWTSNFFTTCARFDRGRICRVTPYIDLATSPESTVGSDEPARFQLAGESLELSGRIERTIAGASFDRGFWVIN